MRNVQGLLPFTLLLLLSLANSCSSAASCKDECTPLEQRCASDGVNICIIPQDGSCRRWALLPCKEGTSCTSVGGSPQCLHPHQKPATCGNAQHSKKCVGQDVYWFNACHRPQQKAETCTNGLQCLNGLCQKPTCEQCTTGAKRCRNGSVEICTNRGNCPRWEILQKCPSGQQCQNASCSGGCQNACVKGQKKCNGNSVQVCQTTTSGCTTWKAVTACSNTHTCRNGICEPNASCQNACRSGEQRCQGSQYQVCISSKNCLLWGASNACGAHQTCRQEGTRVRCVCQSGYTPSSDGKSCIKSGSNNNNNNSGLCGMNTLEKQVFDIVNQERGKYGLQALKCHEKLVTAARQWSTSQCAARRLSHANLSSRVRATGLSVSGYAENVAYGSRTASGVMRQWMNSSGHRRNILSSSSTHLGVGLDPCNGRSYWTQIFVRMR